MPNNSAQFSSGYMTGEGKAYLGTILGSVFLILLGVGFITEGPKHIPTFAAYAVGAVLILLAMLPNHQFGLEAICEIKNKDDTEALTKRCIRRMA